jgi:hypothetical protein
MKDVKEARRYALWQARDGIAQFTKAMESLHIDCDERGADELWDKGLSLWQDFTVFDELVFARRTGGLKIFSGVRRSTDAE